MAAALKRTSLKIGMIPADGVGKEVLPVRIPYLSGESAWTCRQSRASTFFACSIPRISLRPSLDCILIFGGAAACVPMLWGGMQRGTIRVISYLIAVFWSPSLWRTEHWVRTI